MASGLQLNVFKMFSFLKEVSFFFFFSSPGSSLPERTRGGGHVELASLLVWDDNNLVSELLDFDCLPQNVLQTKS